MKANIFIASFSVIFAIAMQTRQDQANVEQNNQYSTNANQTSAGGGR